MPAMSPLMNEGTITRWKKKEGEAFAPGDVLLQIVCTVVYCCNTSSHSYPRHLQESDIAVIDVEAHSPGIIGKIIVRLESPMSKPFAPF
jgi:pyruvate dehydrogenase E2 component (dihydrolipoamide acetyltransferase)